MTDIINYRHRHSHRRGVGQLYPNAKSTKLTATVPVSWLRCGSKKHLCVHNCRYPFNSHQYKFMPFLLSTNTDCLACDSTVSSDGNHRTTMEMETGSCLSFIIIIIIIIMLCKHWAWLHAWTYSPASSYAMPTCSRRLCTSWYMRLHTQIM